MPFIITPSHLPPLPSRRHRHSICAQHSIRAALPPPPPLPTLSRRALLSLAVLLLPRPTNAAATAATTATEDPVVTDRAFLNISVAGTPRGTLTLALYGDKSPEAVRIFKQLVSGTLRFKSSKTVTYRYSQATKVVRDHYVQLGRVNQIDALNQSPGTPQRQQISVPAPLHNDSNELTHDAAGVLSVKRGGGQFEFCIALAEDHLLDESNLVIGRVVDGMPLLQLLANVPTNRKTIRDGYRNVGKLIGDSRANVDVSHT